MRCRRDATAGCVIDSEILFRRPPTERLVRHLGATRLFLYLGTRHLGVEQAQCSLGSIGKRQELEQQLLIAELRIVEARGQARQGGGERCRQEKLVTPLDRFHKARIPRYLRT